MKAARLAIIALLLSVTIIGQTDIVNELYNSSNGITVSVFTPLSYNIGYNFMLNTRSALHVSAYYYSDNSVDNRVREILKFPLEPDMHYNEWSDFLSQLQGRNLSLLSI